MQFTDIDSSVLCDITIRRLAKIIQDARKYQVNRSGAEFDHGITLYSSKSSDYEGTPFEDRFTLIFYSSPSASSKKKEWEICVGYSSNASSEDYDYIAKAARDNNTAYKARTAGPEHEVKFKLDSVFLYELAKSTPLREKAYSDLLWIERIFNILDKRTESLENWSKSNMGMNIQCSSKWCRHNETVFSPAQLANWCASGISLHQLAAKLKCNKCGHKGARTVPSVNAFSEIGRSLHHGHL
ncbi:hypothetical protein E2K99_21730 [Herbaspirillum huttiense]|uniref:hypothetical protein n=1 Tax=Herbaspirillum TaxID=963 RepID=UPI001066B990|nr:MULTISPECIES: hypothetical protein [Herbaspirillum]QBP77445.1 hypothetical protein E2K99_21730 [Herbaspirillum huttiense]QNB09241.1 hypothetical protein G5S34_22465 [Herbaspirillum frisingense]